MSPKQARQTPAVAAAPGFFRGVILFWLLLAAALAVRTGLRPDSHTVFPVLATASHHWWQDVSLYADYKPLDYFRYPPASAVALTPLALLGNRAGGILWAWLSLGIYAWGLVRLVRDVLPVRWGPGRETLFYLLATFGGLRGLWNGQSNALAVGLLLLGAAALVRQRWWRAALWLAAAVLLKLTPVILALLLCALWPRRVPWRLGLALLAGCLVPFLTRPPEQVLEQYHGWLTHLMGMSGERWPGFRDAWTVWLVLQQALELTPGPLLLDAPLTSALYRWIQVLTGLAVLGWCGGPGRESSDRLAVTGTLALGSAWMMLFGPAVEHATYVFLAPWLCWALLQPGASATERLLSALAGVLVLILGWGTLTAPLLEMLPGLLVALPLGTGLFALWLVLGDLKWHPLSDKGEPLFVGQASTASQGGSG
jgi:hypothetical protein